MGAQASAALHLPSLLDLPPLRTGATTMSVLAVVARRARTPNTAVLGRRYLGDAISGPPVTDLAGNVTKAKEFFTKGSVSYVEFKQQCQSLRLFTFFGVTAGCVAMLALDPPKSSYWMRYSPSFWFSNLSSYFLVSSPPVFLPAKAEHETDVRDIVNQL